MQKHTYKQMDNTVDPDICKYVNLQMHLRCNKEYIIYCEIISVRLGVTGSSHVAFCKQYQIYNNPHMHRAIL